MKLTNVGTAVFIEESNQRRINFTSNASLNRELVSSPILYFNLKFISLKVNQKVVTRVFWLRKDSKDC